MLCALAEEALLSPPEVGALGGGLAILAGLVLPGPLLLRLHLAGPPPLQPLGLLLAGPPLPPLPLEGVHLAGPPLLLEGVHLAGPLRLLLAGPLPQLQMRLPGEVSAPLLHLLLARPVDLLLPGPLPLPLPLPAPFWGVSSAARVSSSASEVPPARSASR